jgi:hypothetical protein
MNEHTAANREVATLNQAQTRYVEGSGIRFAYRQLVSPTVAAPATAGVYEPPALGAVGFILDLFSYMRN